MLSVKSNENIIIIKKSKFITCLYHIDNINDIDKYLHKVKNKYKDATHYCYAYILDDNIKCSDDGEPTGTAGIPILQVLEKNNLNHVLCIVVRYFGKILLGAGGLVRAYSKSVSLCLENNIVELKKGYNVDIIFNYNDLKQVDYLLKNVIINNKKYDNSITYNIDITEELYKELKNYSFCKIKINKSIYL